MNTALAAVALTATLAAAVAAQPVRTASRTPLARGTTAIVGVHVIPMTSETVLRDRTVIVRDGRIAAIQPASAAIPAGAVRIAGNGGYLIPGLADAHTHLFADDALADSLAPYELGVMLANGVTTARLMIGTPEQLALRADVMAGRVLGPQLWLASPHLTGGSQAQNGRTIATAAEGRAAVREFAAAGYDLVKLTDGLSLESWTGIIAEARAQRLPVDGHVNPAIGVARAIDAGQHLQHLDGFFEAALADSAAGRPSLTQGGLFRLANWRSVDDLDLAKARALGGRAARAGVAVTPTLAVFNRAFAIGIPDDSTTMPVDTRLQPASWRALYLRARSRYWAPANDSVRTPARRARFVDVRNAIVKAIADSGGRVLAGSDSPEWLMLYGYTLHRELDHLVAAGLTPYQALRAATVTPAEFFGGASEWGTIAVGRRADLVLLRANPLERIGNTTSIEGVAIGGRWLDRAALDAMLDAAAARIGGK